MSKNSSKTFLLGRDSKTGQFIPVREAKRRPNSVTVERIPKCSKENTSKELKSIIIKSPRRK